MMSTGSKLVASSEALNELLASVSCAEAGKLNELFTVRPDEGVENAIAVRPILYHANASTNPAREKYFSLIHNRM